MKIAIIQDGPEYLDLQKTIDKTCDYISDASDENVDVIVFGECWMSGYPIWLDICADINLWDHPPVKEVWAKMYDSALSLDSAAMAQIKKSVKDSGAYVVIGANESVSKGKGNSTLYNAVFTFDPAGDLVNHHRKLMPTYTEKMVHGMGDGFGLKSVPTPFGYLGSLICWEHWMPMTRQAMHDEAEDLHIALWPYAKEMHQIASRHYAFEGRCSVVAVGQVMHRDELPSELAISDKITVPGDGLIMSGGSAIYGPDGSIILAPRYGHREMILSELDLTLAKKERMNLSVSGHYQRPDVFSYEMNKGRTL